VRYSDLIDLLPRRLKTRFESIGGFVDAVIREREDNLPKQRRLKSDDIGIIKLAVLIFALQEFFREGSRAAVLAVDEFQALGVPGFKVGSSLFEGKNENVLRGYELADALRKAVSDPEILSAIDRTSRMRDLVLDLMRRVRT
jgi:hypothetical protein